MIRTEGRPRRQREYCLLSLNVSRRIPFIAGVAACLVGGAWWVTGFAQSESVGDEVRGEAAGNAVGGAVAASAGAATAWNRTSSAYEEAPPNLTPRGIDDHELGDEAFDETFVLTEDHASAGLGPAFNNVSCVGCHVRNGRGMPEPGQLLLRITDSQARPEITALGAQIQDFSVVGAEAEARVDIRWSETSGQHADGETYSLREPQFAITLASNGARLPEGVLLSPRIPPPVFGLGLIEAIAESDILALSDPDDRDGDGISGRPNRVWNAQEGTITLGRFGWKANSPSLLQQSAEAYVNDMGIHNPLYPADDGSAEISEEKLRVAAAYVQTLAVPARTAIAEPLVQIGESLFGEAGCNACHVERYTTSANPEYPALANRAIQPYTDLLLHDMGEGLADNRGDHEADGREWRTPPLWGIGLTQTVLPYSGYLHDGRARTFEEAILWHGGEADDSRLAFTRLHKDERQALVRFLQSL